MWISWLSGQDHMRKKVKYQHFIVFWQNYKYQPSMLISHLEIIPIMWDTPLPCRCMRKLRRWAEDWPPLWVVSQNLIVTLPAANRGSLNWAVMLTGAVMNPTPDDTTKQSEGLACAAGNTPHNKYMTVDLFPQKFWLAIAGKENIC